MKPSDNHPHRPIIFIAILLVILNLVSACSPTTPTIIPSVTFSPSATTPPDLPAQPSPTQRPTPTATLPPLGNQGNPITIAFILPQLDTQTQDAIEEIALFLADHTGYYIEYLIYPDFETLSAAILSGAVHFFWLEPLPYLYLHQAGSAEAVLMTNHLGVYAYGVQFMAQEARGFRSYFDPETNQSTVQSSQALQQFSGTRPCFLQQESLPGYLVPSGLLATSSIPTLEPVIVYDYSAIIRALYIQGICDFGVSYALTGDPRSASNLQQDIPDVQTQVLVIWQSEGIIPNINLSASPTLPLPIQHKIREALLDLPDNPQGLGLLSRALRYDVEALKIVGDVFYQPLRSALAPLDLNLEAMLLETPTP